MTERESEATTGVTLDETAREKAVQHASADVAPELFE
ncbi:hypothetical protein J2751_001776 [Halorubrum alkaliphilum]|uniref:Uncharacterized protein n=1 Tax=Halorubrum alkaliphilum TaxID=261290 RepID=A0A8T4GI25_9EURY|nr:hypothetical protein [Halorubrum alkaliphilum]